ncbi:MAG: hypothetical protein EP317_01540 [Bacillota bacterium]|nr:MAG: hypothetical protein EP317_01540 [Bacillota bacterium]
MKYCKTCHVHYDSDLEHCLLCNGELEQTDNQESTFKFPEMTKRSSSRFLIRFFIYLNIIAAIVSIYFDFANGLPLSWSLVVAVTTLYAIAMYIVLAIPTIWTSKLVKTIILTVLAVILIGLAIRDYRWAIDIVFPFAIMSNILLLSILIVFNKKKWFDYFSSLIIITIIGLVPGLLNIFKVTEVQWPSLICFFYSIFTLLGIIFLPSKSSREEFKRRFHI